MTPYQHELTGKIIGSEAHPGGRWFKIPDRRGVMVRGEMLHIGFSDEALQEYLSGKLAEIHGPGILNNSDAS